MNNSVYVYRVVQMLKTREAVESSMALRYKGLVGGRGGSAVEIIPKAVGLSPVHAGQIDQ